MRLLKPAKRACTRKEKTCHICEKVLIGTSSLNRNLQNIHHINEKKEDMRAGPAPVQIQALGDAQNRGFGKWKKTLSQKYQSTLI